MEHTQKPALPGLSGQKVLITGGLGFIGSNLAHTCLELGAEVTIYDCLDPRSGGNMYNVRDIKNSLNFVFDDIINFEGISRCIANKDILFNCAASTSHPFSMREPLIDIDVNSKGVINLLEATRRFNRDLKFVQVGTSTQLGRLFFKPADETHPEFPLDIYSANKSVSEKYTLLYSHSHRIATTVIRLPNVFGPRATINSSEFTFNNFFIGLALQNKDITIFGDGAQLRNILYVDDAVSALILASQNSRAVGEVFFAVGDEHFSVAQIAQTIVEYLGTGRVRFIEWPSARKDIEVGDAVLSNKKIKETLGWYPQWTFGQGLLATKAYYQDCLHEYVR